MNNIFHYIFSCSSHCLVSDVDECALGDDDCDRVHGTCVNNDGSYACICNAGYETVNYGRTCTGECYIFGF